MEHNNKSSSEEPSIRDLINRQFEILQLCAKKDDIDDIKKSITAHNVAINNKIEDINKQVDEVSTTSQQNATNIEQFQINIEILKQDHLKNNVCISGVPINLIKNDNSAEIVIEIAKKMGLEHTKTQFTSYTVANKKFIVVHYHNFEHKNNLITAIRTKRSLMVEEVFVQHKSNSQIYINDQLTPYFSKIYLMARTEKRDNKLAWVSSYGGKIKARKIISETPLLITSEKQLQALIDTENTIISTDSAQITDVTAIATTSTQNPSSKNQRTHTKNLRSKRGADTHSNEQNSGKKQKH